MGNLMYLEEIAQRVRTHQGDLTLFGRRNPVDFGFYDFIFHYRDSIAPIRHSEIDLVVPVFSFEEPSADILGYINRTNQEEGFFVLRKPKREPKIVSDTGLNIFRYDKGNDTLEISRPHDIVATSEKELRLKGNFDKLVKLRKEIDRYYAETL